MQRTFVISLLICLLAASSCRKQHGQPDPPGNGGRKPDSSARIRSINNNMYAYDGEGRVARITYSNSIAARTDYSYSPDSVFARDFDMQGHPHGGRVTYYLRNDGLADRIFYLIDSSVSPLIITLAYNTDRQLTEEIVADEGGTAFLRVVWHYSKGNADSVLTYSLPGNVLSGVERVEYYADQPNWLGNEHNGISFLGAGNANLEKKRVSTNTGSPSVTEYTYQFDDAQRPVVKHTTVDGSAMPDLAFTWY